MSLFGSAVVRFYVVVLVRKAVQREREVRGEDWRSRISRRVHLGRANGMVEMVMSGLIAFMIGEYIYRL